MGSNVSAQEIPQSEIIGEIEYMLMRIGAFRAAVELEIWKKIADGADTVEKIVAQEGWDPAGVRNLLDAIYALKLLAKTGDRYSLVPEATYYLIPGIPTYKGNLLLYEVHWDGDGKLAEIIRSGRRPIGEEVTSSSMVPKWLADYSRRSESPQSYFELEMNLWQSLDIQPRDGLRVLDIACGPAPRTMELARQHLGVQLTWVDWEGILQNAIKVATELGIARQVSLLPGDLWTADYGNSAFEAVYLGNVTHFFSPEENTRLFRMVHAALAPGGVIVINSVARREIEEKVWDGLWLYAVTKSGGLYDFGEYKAMLENTGFIDVLDIKLGPIKAVKP